jgi:acetyltransferase-like isoleucine patch superfamily enzyme
MKPAMTQQQAAFTDPSKSGFALYKELAVGKQGAGFFAWYELCTLLGSNLPRALGFGFRAFAYPSLFRSCGARPAFGRGVLVRHPKAISIGKKALIDDYVVLDVRGEGASITLGDHVCIGRFSTIAAKGGNITLGDGVNIGSYCRIATQSSLSIGESTLVAAYSYVGPGNHQRGDEEVPLIAREMEIKGGVSIGPHAWIGARATILDGVTIGARAIVGAHALVKENVPEGATVAGIPAKIVG